MEHTSLVDAQCSASVSFHIGARNEHPRGGQLRLPAYGVRTGAGQSTHPVHQGAPCGWMDVRAVLCFDLVRLPKLTTTTLVSSHHVRTPQLSDSSVRSRSRISPAFSFHSIETFSARKRFRPATKYDRMPEVESPESRVHS